MILVTGASGSVGQALLARGVFRDEVVATDIEGCGDNYLDVTDWIDCRAWIVHQSKPDLIYHLAGAKHAPEGEKDPAGVARVNIDGTACVLDAAADAGAKVVVASTCKACDPETAYGASKLIAERATLNAGGVVVRFHNIPESSGNVFRYWESLPDGAPIPVTDCWRYFTPLDRAVDLLLEAADLPSGRYCVNPGGPQWMPDVARRLYPGREQVRIDRRRGDRWREPLHAECETYETLDNGLLRVIGVHDPVPVAA